MKRRFAFLLALGAACSSPPHGEPPTETASAPSAPAPDASIAAPEATVDAPLPPRCPRAESATIESLSPDTSGGSIVLGRVGKRRVAYVADVDGRSLVAIDLDGKKELATALLQATPSSLLITHDGRLVVTLATSNEVALFDAQPDGVIAESCRASVPTEPSGLASTPDGHLVVTSRWAHVVSVLDPSTLETVRRAIVSRDPVGVVLSSDGKRAFVSHVTGSRISIVDVSSSAESDAKPREISTNKSTVNTETAAFMNRGVERTERFALPEKTERFAVQGYSLVRAPQGRILAPEALSLPKPPDGPVGGYGSAAEPADIGDIAVVHEDREDIDRTDQNESLMLADCLLPRAAALDASGKHVLVACLDRDVVAAYKTDAERPHDQRWQRWSVGEGPSGIAIDGDRAYVWSEFARTISVLAIDQGHTFDDLLPPERPAITIQLHALSSPIDATLAKGRALFHLRTNAISADGRVCASCHPDGRDDGLTWSTPEGPRQTPMLVDRLEKTAPYGWDGANPTLNGHVRRTISRLFGEGISDPQSSALFAYIESLHAPGAETNSDATRGREVFVASGCASCHKGDLMTDGKSHDVQSRVKADGSAKFDTPSLLHVGHSAPYFHDGRYATLEELLHATTKTMGERDDLSPSDEVALITYLQTL
jgi:mono/diheme cytochrome c family protein